MALRRRSPSGAWRPERKRPERPRPPRPGPRRRRGHSRRRSARRRKEIGYARPRVSTPRAFQPRPNPSDGLRGEGHLRHEKDHPAAFRHDRFDRVQINFPFFPRPVTPWSQAHAGTAASRAPPAPNAPRPPALSVRVGRIFAFYRIELAQFRRRRPPVVRFVPIRSRSPSSTQRVARREALSFKRFKTVGRGSAAGSVAAGSAGGAACLRGPPLELRHRRLVRDRARCQHAARLRAHALANGRGDNGLQHRLGRGGVIARPPSR